MVIILAKMLFWVYLLSSGALLALQIRRKNEMEIIPSFGWFILITAPFAIQLPTFAEAYLPVHILGIVLTGTALLAADLWKRPTRAVAKHEEAEGIPVSLLANPWLYVAAFLLLAAVHVSLIERIPLWEKYVHRVEDESALQLMREHSSKLLQVPVILKYVFNWSIIIIAPLGITLLIAQKRFIASALFALAAMIYANASLANLPSLMMIATSAVVLVHRMPTERRWKIYRVSLWFVAPVVLYAVYYLTTSPNAVFRYEPPRQRIEQIQLPSDDPRTRLTVGDRSRMKPRESTKSPSFVDGRIDYIAYRVLLGPTDVASRWYQYFPRYSGGFVGFAGILPGSADARFVHPSQRVGNWAYTERFPEWYLTSIHAYASMDADAYAHWGIPGNFVVALLLFILRALIKVVRTEATYVRSLYAISLTLLALLPPMASIQAVLVPNGLAVVIVLMLAFRWFTERHNAQAAA